MNKQQCRHCKKMEKYTGKFKPSFYGGYVCCYTCDHAELLAMQNSMPGAGYFPRLVDRRYLNNWEPIND